MFTGGYGAVRQSVIDLILTNNKEYWAADFAETPRGLGSVMGSNGNYGGLFIRLAWHCNGYVYYENYTVHTVQ